MSYQDKNFKYIDAEAYDRRAESSVLERYVLGLWRPFLKNKISGLSRGTVVDWGCGTGEYASAAKAAEKIIAIDISEEMLKVCRQKLADFKNAAIIKSSGFNGEIDSNIADLVITIGVWEYVDPEILVKEAARIAKKGGKVIAVFPNIYNDLNWMRSLAKMKRAALRPGFIRKIFENDFRLIESASFGNVCWAPKKWQSFFLPVWKIYDLAWRPFQKFLPLGVNVYYLFEKK